MKTRIILLILISNLLYACLVLAFDQSISILDYKWLNAKEGKNVWGRDPFLTKYLIIKDNKKSTEDPDQIILNAIIFDKNRSMAIINNRIVKKGAIINGKEVADILKDRVILRDLEGEKEIKLNRIGAK